MPRLRSLKSTATDHGELTRLATFGSDAVRFAQAEACVDLHCDIPAVVEHAVAALDAYDVGAAPGASAGRDWLLTVDPAVEVDARALDAAAGRASRIDVGKDLVACVLPGPDQTVYWLPANGTSIAVSRADRAVSVQCSTERVAMFWAPRLVRQAMTARLLARGAVYAHAAATAVEDRGVLIAGHAGDGKTTGLLALLRHAGGDFVANDRTLLRVEAGGVVCYPWPIHVRAGIRTLLAFAELADLVPPRTRVLPSSEHRKQASKIAIDPRELTRRFAGTGTARACRPVLMIWPAPRQPMCRTSVELVPADEVYATLVRTSMFMQDPSTGSRSRINHWLFPAPPMPQTTSQLHAVARSLSTDVPCYRVRSASDPAALGRHVTDLLAESTRPPIRGANQ